MTRFHVREVTLDKALREQYLTIIGDPGAGKTTFVRWIAYLLVHALLYRDSSEKKCGLSENTFPVLIRTSELAHHMDSCKQMKKPDCPPLDTDTRWLIHFLKEKSIAFHRELSEGFFLDRCNSKNTLIIIDGLDEAPDRKTRENICVLITNAVKAWPETRFIVTSRPVAYVGRSVLGDFHQVAIAPLTDTSISGFLKQWTRAIHQDCLDQATIDTYYDELMNALTARPEIKRMAVNPVMLTALAVVHWNEKRLPEQRVDLYQSIITWLLRSREQKPGRLNLETSERHLGTLALSMQMIEGKMTLETGRRRAAELIVGDFKGKTGEEKINNAEKFLEQEEIDSGIVVCRGNNIAFWHRSFQEYMAARALGGKGEADQKHILIHPDVLYNPGWREILLLFGGVLYHQGVDKIDGYLENILDICDKKGESLTAQARCAGLIGSIIRDLDPYHYTFDDTRYARILKNIMGIFDKNTAPGIPLKIRVEATDALAQAGDPRFVKPDENWIAILGCTFLMGAQNGDPGKPDYDPDAEDRESPVHKVTLSPFKIAKYPFTVGEYKRFIDDDGYGKEEYWVPGGLKFLKDNKITTPREWEQQSIFLSRPVAGVSWFEAMAFAAWAGADLPTEAEWERATRGGIMYKKYPWGDDEPDGKITHSGHNKLEHAVPVGIFPADCTTEGVIDMGGNVLEWCKDWYDDSGFYKKSNDSTDPVNDESGYWGVVGEKECRTVRGGGWGVHGRDRFRCAVRYGDGPHDWDNDLGFRLVLRSQVFR